MVRDLRQVALGKQINSVLVVSDADLGVLPKKAENRSISNIDRWGKYIIFNLDDNSILVSHLRMTGRWVYSEDKPGINNSYFRWCLVLRSGERFSFLTFTDVRKFGTFDWAKSLYHHKPFDNLGIDGLSLGTPEAVEEIANKGMRSRRCIKNFLLDQKNIAGNGNIYCSEALFYAGVDPALPTKLVDLETVCKTLYYVFCKALYYRGTTFSDYADGYGRKGRFQNMLQVYGRAGEPCYECGDEIVKIIQSGRSTFYCPTCQGRY